MANALQNAGALAEPSNFAPLHTNRIFTGLWTNRSFLRDAATNDYQEHFGMGRQDSILDGLNAEITPRLTLARRPGSTVYNNNNIAPVKRFYSFNTFNLTDELIRVMADTPTEVLDVTAPGVTPIWTKSPGAGSTYFLGVGNTLYFTNGIENKQWNYGTGNVWDWGIQAPPTPPTVTQAPRNNTYPPWQAGTGYEATSSSIAGMLIVDDITNVPAYVKIIPTSAGGQVAVMCGQSYNVGSSIPLPPGFNSTQLRVWVSPGYGYDPNVLPAGVYRADGTGGVLNSAFQNRSGGVGTVATNNWIAIAWTPGTGIGEFTTGNYSGITFRTAAGILMALQIGFGPNGSNINVPAGFTIGQSLSQVGMASCDNVNHSMQGVFRCRITAGVIDNLYDDGSGNVWNGNSNVFTLFWADALTTVGITNGFAVLVPTSGTDTMAFMFAVVPQGQQFGLPLGFTFNQVVATSAMSGHAASPGNRAHGWACLLNGQTFAGYVMDASGNEWPATANVFAVGLSTTATGGNVQLASGSGTTGTSEPNPWNQTPGGRTQDNTISWLNRGPAQWRAGSYGLSSIVMGVVVNPPNTPNQLYVCSTPGATGVSEPRWQAGSGTQQTDGGVIWTCLGRALTWPDLGPNTPITLTSAIVDDKGYLQTVYASGVSGSVEPDFGTELGALTNDGSVVWQNTGAFAVADTAPRQYGYEYENSVTDDLSNMSPASAFISVMRGNHVIVQGVGSADPQVDTIQIFRTAQGGSTFLQAGSVANPGGGQIWSWIDDTTDDDLNPEWQAQVVGEGTPLPIGASCLSYHLGRIVAAVGNVVYLSSGPDAIVGGSSGNAGFDTTFTVQSKITRFWPVPNGLLVFTVRDTYILQGTGEVGHELFMTVYSEDLPLRSYDCFTVNMTNAHMLLANNMVVTLDPGAGIVEEGYPIADHLLYEFDSGASYVTYHKQSSLDTALYVANGQDHWYRMNNNLAPETGSAWSPRAVLPGGMGMGCVQSVEIAPGEFRLLISGTTPGPILQRETHVWSDNGVPYSAWTDFGAIVLAQPGQLAALSFFTLESAMVGTRPSLAVLLGEARGTFEVLNRTHQDPPNLPPSKTIYSDRYHFAQNQSTAWCRYFKMRVEWEVEDVPSELFTYTIFGQTWQEMRNQ